MKGKHEEIQFVCDNEEIFSCITNIIRDILNSATNVKYCKETSDKGYHQSNITFKYLLLDNSLTFENILDGR